MTQIWEWLISPTAEAWAAIGTWLAVVIAGSAAVFAYSQVKEARKLREEQARPYVVATMEQNPHIRKVVEVVFKNYGLTAATDVKIVSNPALRRSSAQGPIEDVWLPDVMSVLAPGEEWRTVWDFAPVRAETVELGSEDRHEVMISYGGPSKAVYEDKSVLDWAAYKSKRHLEINTIHHVSKGIETIAKRMDQIAPRAVHVRVDGFEDLTKALLPRQSNRRISRLARHFRR